MCYIVAVICDTRWVERHTTFHDFDEMYEPVLLCLQLTDKSWDTKAITEANGLLKSITSQFIVTFQTNNYVFGFTKSLSVQLQESSQGILVHLKW